MREHWTLDPAIAFLNHGSFGAVPRVVLEKQSAYRERLEREPVRFLVRELEPLLDAVRQRLAEFLNADVEGVAFVPNATYGVNSVLRSLDLDRFDELLVTTQEYNACRNALDYVAGVAQAKVVVVDVPFPISGDDEVVDRILAATTERTRLLLIDHVTSQTGIVLPVARLCHEMRQRGIDTLVDGAHAPGMLPLDLKAIGAAWYTGNLHKWVCAPKGAAFLYTRANRRASTRPLAISHAANAARTDRSRYLMEFDWTGTFDPTAWLCVADSLEFLGTLLPGGWPELMERNRALVLAAREILCEALGVASPAPASMIGSLAAVPLPDGSADAPPSLYGDPLQDVLLFEHGIEVPFIAWPAPPKRLIRVSAQLYNRREEYETLARLLVSF